eukprot:11239455-Karenia_brevis.AAC.1
MKKVNRLGVTIMKTAGTTMTMTMTIWEMDLGLQAAEKTQDRRRAGTPRTSQDPEASHREM